VTRHIVLEFVLALSWSEETINYSLRDGSRILVAVLVYEGVLTAVLEDSQLKFAHFQQPASHSELGLQTGNPGLLFRPSDELESQSQGQGVSRLHLSVRSLRPLILVFLQRLQNILNRVFRKNAVNLSNINSLQLHFPNLKRSDKIMLL
jgi:hypothetical protein